MKLNIFLLCIFLIGGCTAKKLPYIDTTHFSKVFGKEKTYRIYLPGNYSQTTKHYPVIYFFHGWGGRYFKDDSAKLEYEMLGELVNKYQVILVMWDGNINEAEPRPYNVGNRNDVKFRVQMKDYFPELIAHIDSGYHTLTDRNHRGIIGFSMGGFMSFYLAGKFPGKVSAAVNMVGSPEFFVGFPENKTLYQVRYTFDNLRDVALLFHNRTNCPMSGLNDEVDKGAHWSGLQNYEYHKLEGDHNVDRPGETKIFESAMRFVVNRFENPVPPQKQWSHYDLYPDFDVWGYSVKSDKNEPGFIFLRNIDKNGFGFRTFKWLPAGPALSDFATSVTTAPVYHPQSEYQISIFSLKENKISQHTQVADEKGCLHIQLPGGDCEIAIAKNNQAASLTAFKYLLPQKKKYLRINQQGEFSVGIFNRAGKIPPAKKLQIALSCADSSVRFLSPVQEVEIPTNKKVFSTLPFKVQCDKTPPADGAPGWLRVNVEMKYDSSFFSDVLVLPLFYEVPVFDSVQVDDGCFVAPTLNYGDFNKLTVDSVYGAGNGDGLASPGERVMLCQNGHRLRLFSDDPFVVAADETLIDEFLPGRWPDGFTLSSVVKIAGNCPPGHKIEFLACYETKTYMPMYRKLKWGKVKLEVK
jgi:pimeloyl-ACP methyl ester carboxylesterase